MFIVVYNLYDRLWKKTCFYLYTRCIAMHRHKKDDEINSLSFSFFFVINERHESLISRVFCCTNRYLMVKFSFLFLFVMTSYLSDIRLWEYENLSVDTYDESLFSVVLINYCDFRRFIERRNKALKCFLLCDVCWTDSFSMLVKQTAEHYRQRIFKTLIWIKPKNSNLNSIKI